MTTMSSTAGATYSVSGASVAALARFAASRGGTIEPALAELGLHLDELARPEARVPASANDAVWDAAVRTTGDADLGLHFAERVDLDAFHLVGHLATTAGTFGDALERIVAYSRLLHDAGRTEVEHDTRSARVYPGCRGLPFSPPRQVAEFSAASLVLLGRMVTGAHWVPIEVAFEHGAPARTAEHLRVFGVVPRFAAPETVVVLPRDVLRLPVRTGGSSLGSYLEAYARELLTRLPEHDASAAAQVQRALAVAVTHGVPDIDSVAARLGTTSRTLQRRLKEEGTTFAELSDVVRRSSAERYLADGRLPLAEIAFLLGFQDPSNFHKAFRRWTGSTPAAYRDHHARRAD
jgi:AraC-like DNA-binding protein